MVQRSAADTRRLREELPESAREFLGVIRQGIEEGLNKREIQERIAEAREARGEEPRGIRDNYLTQARRFIQGQVDLNPPSDTRFINRDKDIDLSRGPRPSIEPVITRRYSYTVAIVDTSENVRGAVQVTSSRILSEEEVIAQAEAFIEDQGLEAYVDDSVPEEFFLRIDEFIEASGETLL